MRRIAIICAVYPPEPLVSARMAQDSASHLVKMGHTVSVLCPQPSRPIGTDYSQYVNPLNPVTTCEEGISVIRLSSFRSPQSGLLQRLYESWSLGVHVCRYLSSQAKKSFDVLYVNAWPMLAQALIMHYATRKAIPVVLQIMDIYPESLAEKLPKHVRYIISLPLRGLDKWIARKAKKVSVISESMRKSYQRTRGIPDDRIILIPTWQDENLFMTDLDRSEICRCYNVTDSLFTFLYMGNIGPVSGVDLLINAFHKAAINAAQLLIIGSGSAKASCVELAGKLNIPHIHFISDPAVENIPLLHAMAHVCLLPMRKGTGTSSVPSKLSAYMFSSKPVLATVDNDCDTAEIIRTARCGWVGAPEHIDWLADEMKKVASLPADLLEEYGRSGRQYALAHFSKAVGVRKLADAILAAAK